MLFYIFLSELYKYGELSPLKYNREFFFNVRPLSQNCCRIYPCSLQLLFTEINVDS